MWEAACTAAAVATAECAAAAVAVPAAGIGADCVIAVIWSSLSVSVLGACGHRTVTGVEFAAAAAVAAGSLPSASATVRKSCFNNCSVHSFATELTQLWDTQMQDRLSQLRDSSVAAVGQTGAGQAAG
jgi:hypothetical protein